ncbi:hypothetical protein N072000002_00180 [Clostridium tetani]|nr:hypothetical protein N072000002_00180 [Clostridium tetani]
MVEYFMKEAVLEARKALNINEVPIGAVIVKENKIIGRGHNLVEKSKSISSCRNNSYKRSVQKY